MGQVYTSMDGSNWSPKTLGISVSQDLNAIASDGNGIIVVVGAAGTSSGGIILTSTNGGANWSSQNVVGSSTFWGVTYGGGQFVAVGEGGNVYTSPDGIAWTIRTSNPTKIFNGVVYANGMYVAVGNSGTFITSPNGVNWYPGSSGLTANLFSVAYGGGKFVAVGSNDTIISSADGTNWVVEKQGTTPANVYYGVAYSGNQFVAVGNSGLISTQTWSSNADLSSLVLNQGTLNPAFSPATTSYMVSVPNTVGSLDITPTVADNTATVKVNGAAAASGVAKTITLNIGPNPITVVVTAQDGTTTKTYNVIVNRVSNNANLSSLTVSQGILTPAFSPANANYTIFVPYAVSSLNITPMVADSTATLTINGAAVPSGIAKNVALGAGVSVITVIVTAQDGTTKTYDVTVNRAAPSTNANLSNLAVNQGMLSPAFSAGTTSYDVMVDSTVSSLAVTPTLADSRATVKVNNASVANGTASSSIPLSLNPATITVTVTAEDATTMQTYNITVWKGPSFTDAPTNSSQLVSVGGSLTSLAAMKAAGETLTFTVTGGSLPAGVTLNTDGTFTGTAAAVGNTNATIQASDTHGGTATTTLAVTVQEAPTFTADTTNTQQVVSTGNSLVGLTATAAAGEALTYTVAGGSLPAGITLNANGTFTGTATTVENTTATIQIADTHGGKATTTLAVTVQTAPAFTAIPTNTSQLVSVGSGLTGLAVTMAAGETLTYTVIGGALPVGITLNANGTLAGAVTTLGTTTATILVSDTHGGSATTALAVAVQQAPIFTADAANTSQQVSVGGRLAGLAVTKATGETLTFTVVSGALPAGIILNTDGTFSGNAASEGNTSATIEVTDTHGGKATTTLAVTVGQTAPYALPSITLSQIGWTNQDVTASVYGDLDKTLQYRIESGAWTPYSSALTFSQEGVTSIDARQVDANNNVGPIASKQIQIDKTSPVITLKGDAVINVFIDSTFTDPGAAVTDNLATNLGITVTGNVYTGVLGTYQLQYHAEDLAGNKANEAVRSVVVIPRPLGLSLDSPSYQLKEGESTNARVLMTFSNNDIVDVTSLAAFTSADPTVAAISSSGILSGLKTGTTVIQAVYGGMIAQADVIVLPIITQISFDASSYTLNNNEIKAFQVIAMYTDGQKTDITANTNYSFTIPGIAEIKNNQLQGLRQGQTVLNAVYGPFSVQVPITVITSDSGSSSGTNSTTASEGTIRQIKIGIDNQQNAIIASLDITRIISSDGKAVDKVVFGKVKANEAISKALTNNKDTIRIMIDDLPLAPQDEIYVGLPKDTVQSLTDNKMNLELRTDHAVITLPQESLNKTENASDLYFRFVPIKRPEEKAKVEDRVVHAAEIKLISGQEKVRVVGTPMAIETNFQNRDVKVMFPIDHSSIPADPQERSNFLKSLAVYIEHSDGEKVVQQGTIKYDDKGNPIGIEIQIHKFSTFTLITFNEQRQETVHKPYISGYPDGTFGPDRQITRAEMATLMDRLITGSYTGTSAPSDSVQAAGPFADVAFNHWANASIQRVKTAELMEGDSEGKFRAEDSITRAEMAAIMTRWLKLSPNAGSASSTDAPGHWAQGAIGAVINSGLMEGYPDGTFKPDQALNRAEAVTIINRTLKRGPLKGATTPTWSDVPSTHWAFPMIEEASLEHSFKMTEDGGETMINAN